MTETERDILSTLTELETAARSLRAAGPKPDLRALLARLDELTDRLPKDTAPDLLHFLHRKSYEKARLWLEGHGAANERGSCEH